MRKEVKTRRIAGKTSKGKGKQKRIGNETRKVSLERELMGKHMTSQKGGLATKHKMRYGHESEDDAKEADRKKSEEVYGNQISYD